MKDEGRKRRERERRLGRVENQNSSLGKVEKAKRKRNQTNQGHSAEETCSYKRTQIKRV